GPDAQCTFLNKSWLDFTGRTLAQELGNGWADDVHPDDLARYLHTYHSAFEDGVPFHMDYRLKRADGQYCWFLDQGVPRFASDGSFLGFIGSAVDITERKRA